MTERMTPAAVATDALEHLSGGAGLEYDTVHELIEHVVTRDREHTEGMIEIARHDMDAALFNEIAGLLMSHPDMKALFAMERLRDQYGASTRRRLGLDARGITRD